MKHSEIYDKHADRKADRTKKRKVDGDKWDRKARVSFKNFVREVRHQELEEELDDYTDDEPST